MPSEKYNTLEFYKYMKSDKMTFIIYVDIELLIEKIDGCADNLENYSTTKIGDHILCRCSMSTIGHLITYKQTYFISWGRLYEKVLYFFKRTCYKCN